MEKLKTLSAQLQDLEQKQKALALELSINEEDEDEVEEQDETTQSLGEVETCDLRAASLLPQVQLHVAEPMIVDEVAKSRTKGFS